MPTISKCDADTMYLALSEIGINMRELDKNDPSLQYLKELYVFLLYAQLFAWKSGKGHRPLIRVANQTLVGAKQTRTISKK
jgi:hypothetical protein